MAKAAAPSKKTAKAAKAASTGAKKARKTKRSETFSSYIHKVLKQVHPGESQGEERERLRPLAPHPRSAPPPASAAGPCSAAQRRTLQGQTGQARSERPPSLLC